MTPGARSAAAIVALAGVAAVAGALAHAVYQRTSASVDANRQAWEMRHLAEIIDPALHDNDIANDVVTVRDADLLGGDVDRPVFRAFENGRPVGAVITTVAPRGYSGPIELLVGVLVDGRIAGVRVTAHGETAGLGDRIELANSDWIRAFDGGSLTAPPPERWRVRRDGGDFDQFTGATVTPRAVVSAVRDALLYFDAHRDEIFPGAETEPEP